MIHDYSSVRFPLRLRREAFTLIELMVVVTIIILIMGISMPALKSLMRNNSQAQASNTVRAYLSTARSIAVSQHRQAGVVFFEEQGNTTSYNKGQTALQLIIEDPNQTRYSTLVPGNTAFIYYSRDRQYLPPGIQAATLNDSAPAITGDESAPIARVVLFDAYGQMILRNGICTHNKVSDINPPDPTESGTNNDYPQAYKDWALPQPNGIASQGVSSPGLFVFSRTDYQSFVKSDPNTGSQLASDKGAWIQQHSDPIIVNAYTGNVIR